MKKSLISMVVRSAILIGIIIFLGHERLDVSYIIILITAVIICTFLKLWVIFHCLRMEQYRCQLPTKLRYKCKEGAEDVARRLLRGVESGPIECHFCADYSQLSGFMVLKESMAGQTGFSQEKYETHIVSLTGGGSILEINIPVDKKESMTLYGMDSFIKDIFEAERL